MAYIDLGVDELEFPGITGLMRYRPATAKPLSELADALLRGPSTLSRGERELIAAYVSDQNECRFCCESHSAFAAAQLGGGMPLVKQVRAEPETAPITAKLRALLRIAAVVRESGRGVTAQLVQQARDEGATDEEIHDTVLIAAAFSMYNRYVDGLGTHAPQDPEAYRHAAVPLVEYGYTAALTGPRTAEH